ncbi:MAG: hypothetical protein CSA96_06530 [Bacteroidetes bacterium]|nr:MAG: hypothetical protein CSA96_06530 [Bacteroidota bacterium]
MLDFAFEMPPDWVPGVHLYKSKRFLLLSESYLINPINSAMNYDEKPGRKKSVHLTIYKILLFCVLYNLSQALSCTSQKQKNQQRSEFINEILPFIPKF